MQGGYQDRRRIHFIKKGFQAAFMTTFVSVAVLSVAAAATALNVQSREALRGLLYRSHLALDSTGQVLFPLVARTGLAVFACFLVAVLILTLLVLRRVGGELRALERAMARLGGGDLGTRLGHARWLPDLARLFNRSADALREDRARTVQAAQDAREALRRLRVAGMDPRKDPDAITVLEGAAAGLADLDPAAPI